MHATTITTILYTRRLSLGYARHIEKVHLNTDLLYIYPTIINKEYSNLDSRLDSTKENKDQNV